MKIQKRVSVQGEWAKAKEDFNTGDLIEILNEGLTMEGDYGPRQVFKINTKNGEKNLSFNQTSINNLIDAYGDDTKKWVGKKANVEIIKSNVSGKLVNVVYLFGEDWKMLDDGSVVMKSEKVVTEEGDTLNPEDIPF
jgi:hypothetical protein